MKTTFALTLAALLATAAHATIIDAVPVENPGDLTDTNGIDSVAYSYDIDMDANETVMPRQCEDWEHGGKWGRARDWIRDHYKDLDRDWGRDHDDDWGSDKDWGREGKWGHVKDWLRDHYKDSEHDKDWGREDKWTDARDWLRDHYKDWEHEGKWTDARDWLRDHYKDWDRDWGRDHDDDWGSDDWGHNGDWGHDPDDNWDDDKDWGHDRNWKHARRSWRRYHGRRCGGEEIPEPTAMVLALMGIAGASVVRRRTTRSAARRG